MSLPITRYARMRDGVNLAYQVLGDAPMDLVYMAPWFSNVEYAWAEPRKARFLERLASFSRLVLFDRRGQGLSDREPADRPAPFETRIDDVAAVMDAVDSSRAVVYGASETGPMAALFAALHPERARALVIHGTDQARSAWAPDWPTGDSTERHAARVALIDRLWGTEEVVRALFPRLADDAALVAYIAALQRHSMSPGAAAAAERWSHEIDVRDALPSIRVPTLILHRRDDNPRFDRYFADHIPGAQLVSLPGWEHIPYLGDQDSVTREIERFVRGLGANGPAFDRVLSTVAVVAAAPADRRRAMAGEARRLLEHLVVRYRGRSIPASPRQVAAMFDGPARAAACALAMIEAGGASLGLRGGVHTGEVDVSGPAVRGPAMEAALAIARLAAPGEVLASQMVRDLATGSGLSFTAVDPPEAEGTPDAWHGYRVTGTLVGAPTHAGTTSDVAVGVPHRRAPFGHDALTAREREVLVLVASGHSDGEIAAALFISRKTASVHVSHVKAKLGANSRVELALMARGMRVRDAGRDSCDHI